MRCLGQPTSHAATVTADDDEGRDDSGDDGELAAAMTTLTMEQQQAQFKVLNNHLLHLHGILFTKIGFV